MARIGKKGEKRNAALQKSAQRMAANIMRLRAKAFFFKPRLRAKIAFRLRIGPPQTGEAPVTRAARGYFANKNAEQKRKIYKIMQEAWHLPIELNRIQNASRIKAIKEYNTAIAKASKIIAAAAGKPLDSNAIKSLRSTLIEILQTIAEAKRQTKDMFLSTIEPDQQTELFQMLKKIKASEKSVIALIKKLKAWSGKPK